MLAHVSATQVARLLGTNPLRAPLYRDLAERLRLLVLDGRLAHGDRLPSERELAGTLGCSRITVVNAYALLRDQDLLRSRRGAGTFVDNPRRGGTSPRLPSGLNDDGVIGLTAAAAPAPPGVAAAFARAADRIGELSGGSGLLPEGLPELRERIATRYTHRGLLTSTDQIIITTGCIGALDLVLRATLGGSRRLLIESPTYSNAIDLALAHRARPVTMPVGPDGWDLSRMAGRLQQARPGVAYLIPDFHNPTGALITDHDRARGAALLSRAEVVTIIDETLVDLAFDEAPPARPMACFDDEFITLGSASKSFWGGLRIGWIRAPQRHVEALIRQRYLHDLGSPALEQLVVSELLADDAVLAEQRQLTRSRRDHLMRALASALPEWSFTPPPGGLSLWAHLPRPRSSRLVHQAARHGLTLTPGTRFFADGGGETHLRLPFVCEPDVLDEAVRRLRRAWDEVDARTPADRARVFSA